MQASGFKGYAFGADQQPRFWLEWETSRGRTYYRRFRRGEIEPYESFFINRHGQRVDFDCRPRHWMDGLRIPEWAFKKQEALDSVYWRLNTGRS